MWVLYIWHQGTKGISWCWGPKSGGGGKKWLEHLGAEGLDSGFSLYPPTWGLSSPQKTVSYALRKYLLGSEKSGGMSLCLIFHWLCPRVFKGVSFC